MLNGLKKCFSEIHSYNSLDVDDPETRPVLFVAETLRTTIIPVTAMDEFASRFLEALPPPLSVFIPLSRYIHIYLSE